MEYFKLVNLNPAVCEDILCVFGVGESNVVLEHYLSPEHNPCCDIISKEEAREYWAELIAKGWKRSK